MSFTDLEKVKTRLGIPDTVDKFDPWLEILIAAANCELLVLFNLTQVDPTTYTVSADLGVDLSDLSLIQIEPYPVVSVDAVRWFGADLDNSDPDNPAWLCRPLDMVRICERCACSRGRRHGHNPCRAFVADVTAGFAADSPYLKMLCVGVTDLVASRFSSSPEGYKSEGWGRQRYTRFTPAELAGSGEGLADWPPSLRAAYTPLARTVAMIQASVEC